jgi:hypothetical protein
MEIAPVAGFVKMTTKQFSGEEGREEEKQPRFRLRSNLPRRHNRDKGVSGVLAFLVPFFYVLAARAQPAQFDGAPLASTTRWARRSATTAGKFSFA